MKEHCFVYNTVSLLIKLTTSHWCFVIKGFDGESTWRTMSITHRLKKLNLQTLNKQIIITYFFISVYDTWNTLM